MRFLHLIIAECIKLKTTLSLYFSLIISGLVVLAVYFGHTIDVHSLASLNTNPWTLYFNRAHCIITAFMIVPCLIFLILTFYYVEKRADSKKLLYTSPNHRITQFLAKLFPMLIMLLWIVVSFTLFTALSGYILGLRFPEYEMSFYLPPVKDSLVLMFHIFISCLGILGVQLFLHSLFRSYLIPLGLGFLFFLSAFIMSVMNMSWTKFHPYSFPIVVRDLNFIASDSRVLYADGLISNFELSSLGVFLIFLLLSFYVESKRYVH